MALQIDKSLDAKNSSPVNAPESEFDVRMVFLTMTFGVLKSHEEGCIARKTSVLIKTGFLIKSVID